MPAPYHCSCSPTICQLCPQPHCIIIHHPFPHSPYLRCPQPHYPTPCQLRYLNPLPQPHYPIPCQLRYPRHISPILNSLPQFPATLPNPLPAPLPQPRIPCSQTLTPCPNYVSPSSRPCHLALLLILFPPTLPQLFTSPLPCHMPSTSSDSALPLASSIPLPHRQPRLIPPSLPCHFAFACPASRVSSPCPTCHFRSYCRALPHILCLCWIRCRRR